MRIADFVKDLKRAATWIFYILMAVGVFFVARNELKNVSGPQMRELLAAIEPR